MKRGNASCSKNVNSKHEKKQWKLLFFPIETDILLDGNTNVPEPLKSGEITDWTWPHVPVHPFS
jgi:pSer/pThr/pTyr-binding forkhead associated (FHA) protein